MKKNKRNEFKYIVVAILFVLVVVLSAILIFDPFSWFVKKEDVTVKPIDTTDVEENKNEDIELVKSLWEENSAISKDYVGTIRFESGLIDLPFVKGESNDTYYRTDWKTMKYDEEGSIYMDSNNTLDDQNIILIGHYVYASYDVSGTHMFTPLAKLIDEENYKDNKYVKVYLENELRSYEIAYVYYCKLIFDEYNGESFYYTSDGYEFNIQNYTEEQFDKYIRTIKDAAFYDTAVEVSYNDKLLTLQTCVENRDDLREIVVLKEISRKTY